MSVAVDVKARKAARVSTRKQRAGSFNEFGQKPCGVAAELKLITVNDVQETFHISCLIHTHYTSQDVKADPSADDEFIREDWKGFVPELVMINTVAQQHSDWNIVTRVNRRTGDIWTSFLNTFHINESLELETFPFDRQLFRVCFKSNNASLDIWQLDTDILDFPELAKSSELSRAPYMVSCELNTWAMTGVTVGIYQEDPDPVSLNGAEFEITILAERDPVYFLKNYAIIIYMIVAANCVVLGLDPSEIGDRLATSMTILLTAVANKFVLGSMLPKVGYSTLFDHYSQLSFLFLMAAIAENVAVSPRFRCVGASLIDGDSSATQCAEDFKLDMDDQDKWQRVDAWFQVIFFLAWTGIFALIVVAAYLPSLVRPKWQFVLDNQVGDTENTQKRALVVKDMDGPSVGAYRRPPTEPPAPQNL